MLSLSAAEALARARTSTPQRRYPNLQDPRLVRGPGGPPGPEGLPRFAGALLQPRVSAPFRLTPGGSIFTIGSCFAREIEENLPEAVFPTRRLVLPPEDVQGRANSVLNEFTPGAIAQRIDWALEGRPMAAIAAGYDGTAEESTDLLMSKGAPRPRTRLREIRALVDGIYEDLVGAEALVITLGMAESWYDAAEALWLKRMPSRPLLKADPARYQFRVLDAATAGALLGDALARLIAAGQRRILVTVSPVPLQGTFTGQDCITANAYSKSVMRVVAADLCARFPDHVGYFPSYEMVLSGGMAAFLPDLVHVHPDVVAQVTAHMAAELMGRPGRRMKT